MSDGTISPALDARVREPDGTPAGALVLLHGRGADEHDLFPLLDALDPERTLLCVTPGAPLSLPPGGRHWYVVPRVGYPEPTSFADSYARLTTFLRDLHEHRGIPYDRIVVGGFSQGAVMALATALGTGRPRFGGVLAFSGFVPVVDAFEPARENARGLPVAIGHGVDDPVIDVSFARAAARTLRELGADLLYRESTMPHAIDPAFLLATRAWVVERAIAGEHAASAHAD